MTLKITTIVQPAPHKRYLSRVNSCSKPMRDNSFQVKMHSCQRFATHKIGEKGYCKQHAGEIALNHLMEQNRNDISIEDELEEIADQLEGNVMPELHRGMHTIYIRTPNTNSQSNIHKVQEDIKRIQNNLVNFVVADFHGNHDSKSIYFNVKDKPCQN